jgi:co-chaperonin GroES (HSP10)
MSNIILTFVKNKKNMENLSEKHVLPTKVLLNLKKDEEKITQSGLIIPETVNKVSSLGQVVLCGEGTPSLPMPLKVNDWVMFSPHAGIKVRYKDQDYILIGVQDVLLFWGD